MTSALRKRYELGFVVEQALGHVTHAKNLVYHVAEAPEVSAHWAMVPFDVDGPGARLPVYRSNWTVRAGVRARRAVREMRRSTRLDAIFFHTQVPAMLNIDTLRRIPSVVSLDATPLQYDLLGAFYEHRVQPGWAERLKVRWSQACFGAARHLVTWSEWARQGLIRDYAVLGEKITVIPPGVDVRAWARTEPRADVDGPIRLLFVGGDLRRKGGLDLVAAFERLDDLDVELHLVTRDQLDPRPRVTVHNGMEPNSPALKALYHSCDVFVLPTYGDCLPMVLSEAGAAGLPSVSTRVAAIPEVVVDGDTGLVVPPGDVDALASAIRRLVEHPGERRRLGARAQEHVCRHYDAGANTRRLLAILEQVADGAGS